MRVAATALVAALAVAGGAELAGAARGGGGGGSKRPNPKPLIISGSVDGLYPGVTTVLQVAVTNDHNVAIVVTSVAVQATDAGPACPASVLTFAPPPPGQVIAGRSTADVPVSVTMAADAPDACQGITFLLRHTVTGARA